MNGYWKKIAWVGGVSLFLACSPQKDIKSIQESTVIGVVSLNVADLDKAKSGKWELVKMGDQTLEASMFSGELPYLLFSVEDKQFNGNDGCNGFFGAGEFSEGQISFGLTGGTMMACSSMELGNQFMALFTNKTLAFQIVGHYLMLIEKDTVVLKFKSVFVE